MEIRFYDTKERKKKIFVPINEKDVRFYVCGPTVYDRAHIGNARPAVVFDILFRFLRHVYGKENVTYVRNYTDIDDKINDASVLSKRPIKEITDETIQWYREDMGILNVLEPSLSPRATEYVDEMIKQIQVLIANENAYCDGRGNVLFSVDSYPDYGKFSRRNLDELQAGARVVVNENKRNPMDFVLWKPSEQQMPGWVSPWGRGRPGWHIECSAMIYKLLGTEFDIHGGGIDLIFPHHENELSQSICAHPNKKFANFWMHNGFVKIEGEKMSKSAGNFFTVRDLKEKGVEGEVIRMVLLSTHYRQPLDWTAGRVNEACNTLKKWRKVCRNLTPSDKVSHVIVESLADDLNTPQALTELHKLATQRKFSELLRSARFLGLLLDLEQKNYGKSDLTQDLRSHVDRLVKERLTAKLRRDFQRADEIRAVLDNAGVKIEDTTTGSEWELLPNFDIAKLKAL